MKKLIEMLRSDRPVVGGAFARIAQEFSLDRALVRIVGCIILGAGPYLLGASHHIAWLLSILGYLALFLLTRRADPFGNRLDRELCQRWKDRKDRKFGSKRTWSDYSTTVAGDYVTPPASEKSGAPGQPSGSDPVASGREAREQIGDALSQLEQRLARLNQRIQKMETTVTDRAFDWDRRFRKG